MLNSRPAYDVNHGGFLFKNKFDSVIYFVYICFMMKIEKSIKIDQTRLYTQSEYARHTGQHKQRINQLIKEGEITVVKIKGGTLVLADK